MIIIWTGAIVVGRSHGGRQERFFSSLTFLVRIYSIRLHPNCSSAGVKRVSLTINPPTVPLIAVPLTVCEGLPGHLCGMKPYGICNQNRCVTPLNLTTILTGTSSDETTMDSRFICVKKCKQRWDKAGPFNLHQRTCKHWLAHEEKMEKRRAEAAAQPRKKRRKASLKKV